MLQNVDQNRGILVCVQNLQESFQGSLKPADGRASDLDAVCRQVLCGVSLQLC